MNKILVCYLFTGFDSIKSINKFIKFYQKYNSGINHTLLVCIKMIKKKDVILIRRMLKNINYIEFIDPINSNDYDFGSYARVAKLYPNYKIFFLNSHSYPIINNWLKKIVFHYKNNTVIGTSASYQSLLSSLKLKKFYKFLAFLIKYLKYKNKFKPFPNPHIRTSSFLIKGSDFLSFVKYKKFYSKEDTWVAESGYEGLTNFFKNKRYNIYVVNSDGLKFDENQWKLSETYNYLKQSKSLISDKHSRKYLQLSSKGQLIASKICWGK